MFYHDGHTTKYYIQHERIGTWNNTKAPKYRRCYQKPEHYEYLNKQIEIYEKRLKEDEQEALEDIRAKLSNMAELFGKLGEASK